MRKLLVATLLVGLGLAVGTHGGATAGGDGAALTIGTGCDDSDALIYAGINGGSDGQLFDLFIDGNLVAEDLGPNAIASGYGVDDGVHTVTLQVANDSTVLDEQIVGSGCGEPVIAIEAACQKGAGAFSILTNENNSAFNYAIEVDGVFYRDGIGNSAFPELYGPFPDGIYFVEVRASGPSEWSSAKEIEIDCVDGDGGEPAVFEVDTYCDGTGYLSLEIQSFTYGELFSITIDGTLYQDEMFGGEYEFPGMSDGAIHVVITSTTDGVVYDDVILVACIAPEATAKATCEAGVGTVWFKSLDNTDGYSFFVSVDGVDVEMWQDAPDTEGLWESLHEFPEGDPTALSRQAARVTSAPATDVPTARRSSSSPFLMGVALRSTSTSTSNWWPTIAWPPTATCSTTSATASTTSRCSPATATRWSTSCTTASAAASRQPASRPHATTTRAESM